MHLPIPSFYKGLARVLFGPTLTNMGRICRNRAGNYVSCHNLVLTCIENQTIRQVIFLPCPGKYRNDGPDRNTGRV